MSTDRHEHALLAGVCADLAQRLGWNVWALRAVFVAGLLIQTLATGIVYVLLAILLPRFRSGRPRQEALSAPELRGREARIVELERRFRDLERESQPR